MVISHFRYVFKTRIEQKICPSNLKYVGDNQNLLDFDKV